jgi:sigma-B regulation protein RsbU (phosphoserine phosphatase)
MAAVSAPHILVCTDDSQAADDIGRVLHPAQLDVQVPSSSFWDSPHWNGYDLLVVNDAGWEGQALSWLQRLAIRRQKGTPPVLFLATEVTPARRLACMEAGADTLLTTPTAPGELAAAAQALLRLGQVQRRLLEARGEARALNRQLRQAHRQINQDQELAHRLQRSLRPQQLPAFPQAHFAVHHRPSGRVGGDCFDVVRLGEERVVFYLADVLGHGVAAGLLALFLHRVVVTDHDGPLSGPDETLKRLNNLLLEQGGIDPPLVMMVYGQLDLPTRTLKWARAGLPAPLYVPNEGPAQWWAVPGCLLGVSEASFTMQTIRLNPGDKVLFTTDGLRLTDPEGTAGMDQVLVQALQNRTLPLTGWIGQLALGLAAFTSPEEDWTMLGLEIPAGET